MTTTEWNIQPRSSACTACQRPFADKQTYHTLLAQGEGEGYIRQDFCPDCNAQADRQNAHSYWQAEFKMPAPPAPEAIRKDTAETLLRSLTASTDPNDDGPRYILAVMLERKRILKHRDTIHEAGGREVMVYEHATSGETFTLPDPHLRLDQLEQVQRQVAELLGGGKSVSVAVPVEQEPPVAPAPE